MDFRNMVHYFSNRGRFRTFIKTDLALEKGDAVPTNELKIKEYSNLDWFVLLNKHNSDIVENLIEHDDGYVPFTKMLVEYHAAKNTEEPNVFPKYDRLAVLAIVRMIDIENSTNVWRFNRELLLNMVDYIIDRDNDFWNKLTCTEPEEEKTDENETRKKLVETLAGNSLDDDDADDDESEGKAKPNSLASKVCKYFAQYICGDDECNLYFINDSFVRKVLPYYYYFYTGNVITKTAVDKYKYHELFEKLDEVLNAANEGKDNENDKISRGEMDHIMWYCYKNSGNTDRTAGEELLYSACEYLVLKYGVYPIDQAVSVLNKKIDKKNFFSNDSFSKENALPDICSIEDGFIVCNKLDEQTIEELKESQKDKATKPLTRLEFSNLAYVDNTQIMKICSLLRSLDTYTLNERIDNLLSKAIKGDELNNETIYNELTSGITLGKDDKSALKVSIRTFVNTTRLPRYNGLSKDEFKKSLR